MMHMRFLLLYFYSHGAVSVIPYPVVGGLI